MSNTESTQDSGPAKVCMNASVCKVTDFIPATGEAHARILANDPGLRGWANVRRENGRKNYAVKIYWDGRMIVLAR